MVGAALLASLCTYAGVFKSAAASIVSVAVYKAGLPFGVVRRKRGREGTRGRMTADAFIIVKSAGARHHGF